MKKQLLKTSLTVMFAFTGLSYLNAQVMVKDIYPGPTSSNPAYLYDANGSLFFTGKDGSVSFSSLFVSDGTSAGTQLLTNNVSFSFLQKFGNIGSIVFFNGSVGGDVELYKSDGTAVGTVLVKNINASVGSDPLGFTNYNNNVYFSASDGSGTHLWRTDGTTLGTYKVTTAVNNPNRFTEMNGLLYFGNNSGELWQTDGTAVGTVMIKDMNPASSGSFLGLLTVSNNKLFFVVNDGTSGNELWVSDGTTAGTNLVKDINPGAGDGLDFYGAKLTNLNGTLLFAATNPASGTEIWKSDGTSAGTILVKDIKAGSANSLDYSYFFTVVNNDMYFAAEDVASGNELWKTDGTLAGTVMVKDIAASSGYSNPLELININNTLYFSADNGTTGKELWKSDGTAAGTTLVMDIKPVGGSNPTKFTNVGGNLFFIADDGINGIELWYMNGGTLSVMEFDQNSINLFPNPSTGKFNVVNSKVKFQFVEIYNMMGDKILSQENTTEIDLSNSAKGIYFAKFYDEAHKVYTKKIIVE